MSFKLTISSMAVMVSVFSSFIWAGDTNSNTPPSTPAVLIEQPVKPELTVLVTEDNENNGETGDNVDEPASPKPATAVHFFKESHTN